MVLAEETTMIYVLNAAKVLVAFGAIMSIIPLLIWLERKLSAWIQHRDGPSKVGLPRWKIFGPLSGFHLWGLLQPLADVVKLLMKEDFAPRRANKLLFLLAPAMVFIPIALAFAVIPFGHGFVYEGTFIRYQIANFGVGILFAVAALSVAVHGITLGGWASNNKYAQMGAVRAGAQMISYEAAMFIAMLAVVLHFGSLNLNDIVLNQAETWGGFGWGIFRQPIAFVIFLVCAFAETNRLPFDFPEAEPELVAGYHIEYGSMKFALFFLGEYFGMIVQCALIVTLFLGGWTLPWVDPTPSSFLASIAGPIIFSVKVMLLLWLFIQVRWTLPRFRFDQLMNLGWKRLIPISLANLVFWAGYLVITA